MFFPKVLDIFAHCC